MPVPAAGLPASLQNFLNQLDRRVSALEAPQGFLPAFLTTSATLSSATANSFSNTWAFAIDLKTAVWSDGVHWYRADTGAVIV